MRLPLVLAAVSCLVAGCGGAVPRATIAPVKEAPAAAAPRAAPSERISPASTIEVVGSDTITGDHVVRVRRFSGKVSLAEPITCDFVADMTSLSAESQIIEDFIKSSRFLDVRHFPEARFTTTKVGREADGYRVEGRLALHGVEKEISFPATLATEDGIARVRANFSLPRHAFGLVLGGVWEKLLDDDIKVKLDLIVGARTQND